MKNNLPSQFIKEIEKLENFLLKHYQNRLKLLSLTGSAAYGKIIDNVSDLDFLVLLDEASPDDYRNIFSFKNSLKIKMDMIIITMRQIEHLYLDYNSIYYLYLLKIGHIKPLFITKDFNINISKKVMFTFTKNILSLNIRTLKRLVYDQESKDTYLILKYTSYVIKNYLILHEIYAENIKITFNEFYKLSNIKLMLDIEKTLNNNLNENEFTYLLNYVDKIVIFMNSITTEELMLDENGKLFETIPQ